MLILDEQRQERRSLGLEQESYADKVNGWTKQQLGSARIIADKDLSVINPQRQLGNLLPGPQRLEKILASFSPNFVFEHGLPGKKTLSYLMPHGELRRVCVYEAGPTPEYSIMTARWNWAPDPDYALGGRQLHRSETRGEPVTLQAAYDLIRELGTEGAKRELLRRREGCGQNDPNYRPGFKKVLESWSEAVRGWRSVLVRPLQMGLITLSQAKQAVQLLGGTEDRASWTVGTGQQLGLKKGF